MTKQEMIVRKISFLEAKALLATTEKEWNDLCSELFLLNEEIRDSK